MDEYELFECRTDGSLNWRGLVRGLESARVTVCLLADEIGRECFAMDSTTREVVLARTPLHRAERVFHVGYGKKTLTERAHLLQHDGYDVTSVLGNQVAKFVLCMHPPYDLFVIDQVVPDRLRLEMLHWLHANYPDTRIVALDAPQSQDSDGLRIKVSDESAVMSLPSIPSATDQGLVMSQHRA